VNPVSDADRSFSKLGIFQNLVAADVSRLKSVGNQSDLTFVATALKEPPIGCLSWLDQLWNFFTAGNEANEVLGGLGSHQ
jgi:hypothetical protein